MNPRHDRAFVDPQRGVFDVAVVGAGVVGTAIARDLVRHRRSDGQPLSVVLLDAGSDVGEGTSKANTAIWHTGFDAMPGTLESRLVRRGYHLLEDHAQAAGIALERTGALLVAWDDEQMAALPGLEEKARANGYLDTRIVGLEELRRREPHLGQTARAALEVPGEGIIDPWSVTTSLAYEFASRGGEVRLAARVEARSPVDESGHSTLVTSGGPLHVSWIVNAAGLGAADLDALFGVDPTTSFTVKPRRGQLIVFDKLARPLISHILLPVPTKLGKGVLVSPTVFGNVLLGPTAEELEDSGATQSTRTGLDGLLAHGRRILPSLLDEEITAVYAGMRAATEESDYRIRVHPDRRVMTVGGIRSTGLTASLAIAEYVTEVMREAGAPLGECAPAQPYSVAPLGESQVRRYQDDARITRDPAYADIVCHCERVTAGEVRDARQTPVPAVTLDGLRRRTRAGNGRCQQFYCAGRIAQLMSVPR